MQVHEDKLYGGIENGPSPILFLYLLSFLSLHAINTAFFVIDFSATFQDGRLIFCMSIDKDLLHCGIENRHSPVYSSLYMSFFLSLQIFVKDIFTTI